MSAKIDFSAAAAVVRRPPDYGAPSGAFGRDGSLAEVGTQPPYKAISGFCVLEKIKAEVQLQVERALAGKVRSGPEVVEPSLNAPPGRAFE